MTIKAVLRVMADKKIDPLDKEVFVNRDPLALKLTLILITSCITKRIRDSIIEFCNKKTQEK
jgi:hypothetical protein